MVVEIIQREVPTRGIGYIILRDCPEERLGEALGRGMEKLKKAGAKSVLATSLPEGEPLQPGPCGVWRLTHVHDMVAMEAPLTGREKPQDKLVLRPLKRSSEDRVFLELAGRSFDGVPNARTYTAAGLHRQGIRAGLAYQGEELVGLYEVDLTEKIPALAALAIAPELRRQGLGRRLLRTLLDGMRSPTCTLTVSSANLPALELFRSEGFAQTGVVSNWFEVV